MPEPYYTTAADLQTALGVTSEVLSDAQATVFIEDAEDVIDELLGGYPIDETTGRKIVEANVDAHRFAKLKRATTKLAALLYQNPDLVSNRQWMREKGPDFEFEGPLSGVIAKTVLIPLNQSGLRRVLGHARTGRPGRRYDSFFDATRHDGT